jgi:ubiquinone/menaquinone biosynthesis C-methylase UbiE
MSVDALQYAPDKPAAFVEAARILRPGGRFGFFAFEVAGERVTDLPVIGVDPVEDYRPLLDEAGLSVLRYEQTPGWEWRLEAAYRAILDAEASLRAEMGETAFAALSAEVGLTLEREPYRGHVFVVAERLSSA